MLKPSTPANDLVRTQILDVTEALTRKLGTDAVKVIHVAREMGVSHTTIYRYFKNKEELRHALAERWLKRIAVEMEPVAAAQGDAEARLRTWFRKLYDHMQDFIQSDPELLQTYNGLAESSRDVVDEHVKRLTAQLYLIISDGVRDGDFVVEDKLKAADAIYIATIRNHHPYFLLTHKPRWHSTEAALTLMIAGLRSGAM